MITVNEVPGTNILEMEIDGAISPEEFDQALEKFDVAIKQHGSVKVLELIGEIGTPPIPWSRFWDDIKFGFEHLSDISHIAVVADQSWITAYVRLVNPFFRAEVKAFQRAELEEAREWLGNAS